MPLESPNRVADLNAAWPLDSDPAALGAAHLRLIKNALKQTFIGSFFTQADVTTYVNSATVLQTGMTFAIEGVLWSLVPKAMLSSPFDTADWFSVNSVYGAVKLTRPRSSGRLSTQGSTGAISINSTLRRRPAVRVLLESAGLNFPVADANALFPGGAPVNGDICIRLGLGNPQVSQIYLFNGSWAEVDHSTYIHAGVFGTFAAQVIQALSIDTDRVRTRKQEILGETNLYVYNPDGFGPDSLVEWLGDKTNVVATSGEVLYDSLTIANAISYRTLTGLSGGSGEPPAPGPTPVDPSTVTVLSNLGSLGTSYGSETDTYGQTQSSSAITLVLQSNGQFTVSGEEFRTGTPASGAYLSETGLEAANEMQVRFTSNNPSVMSGAVLNTWHNLSSSRAVSIIAAAWTTDTSTDIQTRSAIVTVEVRKGTGTPETKAVTLSATARSYPGIIP